MYVLPVTGADTGLADWLEHLSDVPVLPPTAHGVQVTKVHAPSILPLQGSKATLSGAGGGVPQVIRGHLRGGGGRIEAVKSSERAKYERGIGDSLMNSRACHDSALTERDEEGEEQDEESVSNETTNNLDLASIRAVYKEVRAYACMHAWRYCSMVYHDTIAR